MKGIIKPASFAICAFLIGCVTAPTPQQLAVADYGERPQHPEVAIHAYFDTTLKDPSSAQYREITAPQRNWIRGPLVTGGKMTYGWAVDVTINAKNSFGAYVGFKTYTLLFRGEQIVDSIDPTNPSH